MQRESLSLNDKYDVSVRDPYLSGLQALVRLPLLQRAADVRAGLRTAGFISGYRGSPLAGLDQQLWRASAQLGDSEIHFAPGLNEELAATAVAGSQQVGLHPGARFDGVFGLWYGKAPGVDRACDALRHANAAGTAPHGGVLLVAGDDHACKSSSYPSQSGFALAHLEIPVLAPSSVQDVLDFGLLGWAMSRYAGLWVSLIALTDLMDGSSVVRSRPAHFQMPGSFVLPEGGLHIRAGDEPLAQEVRLREFKLPAAIAFAHANQVDHVAIDAPDPALVVLAAGKAYTDCRQAFSDLGLDAGEARRLGIRLVKIGMPWPLDARRMRALTAGARTVFVVEEKRALIEPQLKDALFDLPDARRPEVLGKFDRLGAPLLARVADLDALEIARAMTRVIPADRHTDRMDSWSAELEAREMLPGIAPTASQRTPFFCSGCPHNTSTRVPEGSRALVGIGCHYMVKWMDRNSDHVSQMGGEGAAWIGQAPFTDEEHVFANLGDGTYLHSGILAIRAAVNAKARITYKLLFNDAVAMTGGQPLAAGLDVARITRQLAAEGVAEIVVVSETPERFEGNVDLAPGVRVHPRSALDAEQRRLRDCPGVSVLIYDQGCAAEKRRKRRRGLVAEPDRRIFINEALCEGCGDCSVASNCLSVEPVETELGRKRRINQSACNKDFSCLDGSCPALVTVEGGALLKRASRVVEPEIVALPDPVPVHREGVYNIVLAGMGGTGVTTVAALLGTAGHIEGRAVRALDMTGLAQKGGAVVSHLRLADPDTPIWGARVPHRSADLLLGCDMVVAASEQGLDVLDPMRSRVVLNAHLAATAAFVMNNSVEYDCQDMADRLACSARAFDRVDATRIAESMLGDAMGSNLFLLGHAYQKGGIPLTHASIERAIALNGVAVEMNTRAFGLGRLAAHDEKLIDDWMLEGARPVEALSLDDLIERRCQWLVEYQDHAYAQRYRHLVERVRGAEAGACPGETRLTTAVARSAYKLMAYKDEYEVARLHTGSVFAAALEQVFEGDFQVAYHFSPPALARRDPATGRLSKRRYGPWMCTVLRALAWGKRLRGTPVDPFGWLAERRLERELVNEFEATILAGVERLTPENHDILCRLAALPEEIRGFDVVRYASLERARGLRAGLLALLDEGVEPPRG
jgi:indolepyruvate ferredoxin oxidoreductase